MVYRTRVTCWENIFGKEFLNFIFEFKYLNICKLQIKTTIYNSYLLGSIYLSIYLLIKHLKKKCICSQTINCTQVAIVGCKDARGLKNIKQKQICMHLLVASNTRNIQYIYNIYCMLE